MGHRREEKDTSLAVVDCRDSELLRAFTHAIDNLLATWRQPFYGHQRIVHQPRLTALQHERVAGNRTALEAAAS